MNRLLNKLANELGPVVVLSDGELRLTGSELYDWSGLLAAQLCALKVKRLALFADNSLEWIVCDLACQLADIPFLPLPVFFTPEQCAHAVLSSGVDTVLSITPELLPDSWRVLQTTVLPGMVVLQNAAVTPVPLPENTGKITFTSGSIGTPKGVCLSNEQLLVQAQVLADTVGLTAPVHLCVLPLSTLLENIAGVYAPLLAGGRVEVRSLSELGMGGSRMVAPEKFLQTISATQPDTLILIPQMLQFMVQSANVGWQPPPMKFIAVGGSRVSEDLIHAARNAGLPVYEGYGLSECASVVSLNTPRHNRPGTCGKPLKHVLVRQADGQIIIEGNAMQGYVGDPDSWGQHAIQSGDLGSLDADGYLRIEGRSKNVLISSYGRNIAPEWVESELMASPVLAETIVLGDARPWCVALVTPRIKELPDALIDQVIARANARLPDYAQVKQWLRLPAPLAANPAFLTANGRPRRDEIERSYQPLIDALYASATGARETMATQP